MKTGPGAAIAGFATRHPWLVTLTMVQITLVLALLAALPSVWPERFSSLSPLKIDTDPENMLPHDEPVRLFHDHMKEEFKLYDMVVVGVVNEQHPDGVFNPDTLRRVAELTDFAKTLRWDDPAHPGEQIGVVEPDIIAPSTVDNIRQGDNRVVFEWLMPRAPTTTEEALRVRDQARRIPFLDGTLVSDDGQALAIYLPLTSKDLSSRVYYELQRKIATFDGDEQWHITGLPVAEDVFGVEMFKQMAISAPVAMLVIFLLMLLFFRKLTLIVSPMIIAMVCVIMTMGLLVITGNTVHIMSSMIPIFIMPIAVLDAVHILSEFFDRYQATKDRQKTIVHVIDTLFWPMLYTSLTTVVGFASLAFVSIPPVQVFGIFVAIGVALAWVWTIAFIPAFVMFIKPASLENFGHHHHEGEEAEEPKALLSRLLVKVGRFTYRRAKAILAVTVVLTAIAVYGITQIRINDNPIKWFEPSHPIRVADKVLNAHFGGTYMAYLTLQPKVVELTAEQFAAGFAERLAQRQQELAAALPAVLRQADASLTDEQIAASAAALPAVFDLVRGEAARLGLSAVTPPEVIGALESWGTDQWFAADEAAAPLWPLISDFIARERGRLEVFKQPEVLRFISDLQTAMAESHLVGKSNSLADIVKTVYRELQSGEDADYRVPETAAGVAQTLIQYQSSHRPNDLDHLVDTGNYRQTVLWVQLKSGDNRDMVQVVDAVNRYLASATMPLGIELEHQWFGLTYINIIWQERMVTGMLSAFLGSFLIVFLMMTILYRSALWGLLSMIPLTVTIALIYGALGLFGFDYNMPVAVLSSLSLGLAVDYAIHFLSRSRELYLKHGSWQAAAGPVFSEPARAITRNAIVIGVGFLPLLLAPLVPYQTVGVLIAAILLMAGLASLLILPALMRVAEPLLFPRTRKCCLLCNCTTCMITAVVAVVAVVMNIHRFLHVGWTHITWGSLVIVVILLQICYWIGRSKRCKTEVKDE